MFFYSHTQCPLFETHSICRLHCISSAVLGENLRYCFILGIGAVVIGVQKLCHFVISLLLLKIFTLNLEYMFTIQRAIHPIKGDNSKCFFFFQNYAFSQLRLLSFIKQPTAKCWHQHAVLLLQFRRV